MDWSWRYCFLGVLAGVLCIGCDTLFGPGDYSQPVEIVVCEVDIGADDDNAVILRVVETTTLRAVNVKTGNQAMLTLQKGAVVRAATLEEVRTLPKDAKYAAAPVEGSSE